MFIKLRGVKTCRVAGNGCTPCNQQTNKQAEDFSDIGAG